ncbi:proline-, glutamic acid- and leucine-rich protein 1 [Cryptococcus neoformans Th84]|nr:proline-, glutamic acid- and leucine-rich protein 1 [Cryptococcus neoformans var. grubii Th84]OXH37302.1 proline-, glutamic acid- and leucine-rich protein 1 [Cryptococcus neoformans var. grubii]OXH75131.1 proline-, glutamic acid- and leucine-rich protein 1 [Cryptococcus neoformans var. grubii]
MRTANISKPYRSQSCPFCKSRFKTGQRHNKELCALAASARNGEKFMDKIASLRKKRAQPQRRRKGYVTVTETDDNQPPEPSVVNNQIDSLAPSSFGRRRHAPRGFEDFTSSNQNRYNHPGNEPTDPDPISGDIPGQADCDAVWHVTGAPNEFGLFRKMLPGYQKGSEGYTIDSHGSPQNYGATQDENGSASGGDIGQDKSLVR